MSKRKQLPRKRFQGGTVTLARELIGCQLCRRMPDGSVRRLVITETEAYDGPEDLACHAHTNRKTKRNAVMFERGGICYVYLCYGIHWLLNLVTGPPDYPAAVLIRGAGSFNGPGKLTKGLAIDGANNRQPLTRKAGLWIEEPAEPLPPKIAVRATPRIGIDYAGPYWSQVPYRFLLAPD